MRGKHGLTKGGNVFLKTSMNLKMGHWNTAKCYLLYANFTNYYSSDNELTLQVVDMYSRFDAIGIALEERAHNLDVTVQEALEFKNTMRVRDKGIVELLYSLTRPREHSFFIVIVIRSQSVKTEETGTKTTEVPRISPKTRISVIRNSYNRYCRRAIAARTSSPYATRTRSGGRLR